MYLMGNIDKNSFIPHVLLEDEDYQVFLQLVLGISEDIRSIISVFPEIVDVDTAPELFLPKLCSLINYQYRYDIDPDYQREVIKRIIQIYKDRGTDDSIIMAATYGDDKDWIGSHLFLPGANTSKDRAELLYPVDQVFTWNKSKYSGTDKIQGPGMWRSGTILIKLPKLNDKIIEAIRKVIPAGIRIYYQMSSEIIIDPDPDDSDLHINGIVSFGKWTLYNYTDISMELIHPSMRKSILIWSKPGSKLSGRSVWSGKRGTISFCLVENTPILPSDNSYWVESVEDKYIKEFRKFESPDIEVIIKTKGE